MIAQVQFVPLACARTLPPSKDTVVISILDGAQHKHRPSFSQFRDALELTFLDLSEELVGARAGDWPNEPSDDENLLLTDLFGERLPALSDGVATVRFLRKHHRTRQSVNVVVHCFAGASRSAAVAKWTAARFGVPLVDPFGAGTRDANKRVLRMLRAADRRAST